MTRTQATSIITGMLIAVEQAGYTKHHTIAFGHTFAEITIFSENGSESLDEVRKLLRPSCADGITISREFTTDREVEYLNYNLRFD